MFRPAWVNPMRLAGTCRRYSKKAIPQLSSAATYHGEAAWLRRWPYQAKVMNRLLAISRAIVARVAIGAIMVGQGRYGRVAAARQYAAPLQGPGYCG